MELFRLSGAFPKEERYALTDQLRRSSRAVSANIAEGYRKKRYPRTYISKLVDTDGELAETSVWIDFARECGYLSAEHYKSLAQRYQEAGRMLNGLIASIEAE
jgi:four helix bundle protein